MTSDRIGNVYKSFQAVSEPGMSAHSTELQKSKKSNWIFKQRCRDSLQWKVAFHASSEIKQKQALLWELLIEYHVTTKTAVDAEMPWYGV